MTSQDSARGYPRRVQPQDHVDRYGRPRKLVIVGAGESAEIAYEYFTYDSPHTVVGFGVEEQFRTVDTLEGLPVISLDSLPRVFPPGEHSAFVAVSSTQLNRLRRRLFDRVKELGYNCASYISSRSFVWRNVSIGENVFVFEDNVLQHHVRIGDNVVLWSGNHIGHRTVVEDDCFVSSHVVISGFCTIGRRSFLGVNACFADEVNVGEDSVVGAGAVVIKDLPPRGVYVGNPARPTGGDPFHTFGVPTP
jgi:sugar O-acyltransferase (sialic acid O-acetyltransferase NeuD family)